MRSKAISIFFAALMISGILFSPIAAAGNNTPELVTKREATINVKVVLVGIDPQSVQPQYLQWNVPDRRFQLTVIPGISTDTTYTVNYNITFAPPGLLQDFTSYLSSVARLENRINVLWNETYFAIQNSYFLNYTHFPVNATNTFYAADQVEDWLLNHAQDFGGLASDGYTLILADLSKQLPSVTPAQFQSIGTEHQMVLTPHFYNKTFADHDLDIKLNRRYMTAWGGHSRFFFIDLSAGPGSAAEQLPLQLAAWINRIEPNNSYWSSWLTQYLADYIYGAVYNILLPDFIYPLNYAQTYRLKIFVFDNRTTQRPPIQSTLDPSEVKAQLSSLLPFAKIEVEAKYQRLNENPALFNVVKSATSPSLSGITPIVDARPVYNWLSESGEGHVANFTQVTRNLDTYDIPVFVFAFDGDYTFGFTYKELIAKDVDFDRTIWGVALYDMVLVSHSAYDLLRGDFVTPKQPGLGFGFTNTVIHEVGHMVGLMHPFHTSYDPTENFVSSVMAYYPYENSFSQFDKDALLRGYADQLIRGTVQILKSSAFVFINWPDISSANSKLSDAEAAYDEMDYAKALEDAYGAYVSASRSGLLAGGGNVSNLSFTWVVGAFSFLLGVLITFVLLRRRTARTSRVEIGIPSAVSKCSVCKGDLTWIPQYQRWYCHRCQRYE